MMNICCSKVETDFGRFESQVMEVVKSLNDRREYRVITLENGLTALLISDMHSYHDTFRDNGEAKRGDLPEGDNQASSLDMGQNKMSAASLCIGVGSFCDPQNIPGLAHFLEHMVFMGSKKYPRENELDDFLAKHCGNSNASTDCDQTVFYFDVQREHFHKALDIFAHFFISPLLRKNSVDREIQAVESEFEMSVHDDEERVNQLMGLLVKSGHPMGHFYCGNKLSLKTIPKQMGVNVYRQLKNFYHKMYSSHYMTLAIQSKETLDTLQQWVCEIFSAVPNNNLSKPAFKHLTNPFQTSEFAKFYKVSPVQDGHLLRIRWAFPPLKQHYREKPLYYLSSLILAEGKGSLLSFLKKHLWALSIDGGSGDDGFEENDMWSCLSIVLELTDSGLEHIDDVLIAVFEYIHMMQQAGPQRWIFDEQQAIEQASFRWKQKGNSLDYVVMLSENMQHFDPPDYLTGDHLLFEYNEQLLKMCFDQLNPAEANVMLLSKTCTDLCDRKEKWYGAEFHVSAINPEWIAKWKNSQLNPEFCLPEPNEFIATDFTIKELAPEKLSKYPYLIRDNPYCKMWYKKDTKFFVPKVHTFFNLVSPLVWESLESATLFEIFSTVLFHNLTEPTYLACMASLSFSVNDLQTGLLIEVGGFNDKLFKLFKIIVDHIADFQCSEGLFETVKSQLKKDMYNNMIKPYELTEMLWCTITDPQHWPVPDKHTQISELSLDMMQNFVQKFKKQLFVEALTIGNITPEESCKMMDYLVDTLGFQPLPASQHPQLRLRKIPVGQYSCSIKNFNPKDTNSCSFSYYQSGPGTIQSCCLNELLVMQMDEPCFDYLRTKCQLGYSVFVKHVISKGILGLSVCVEYQATKFSTAAVNQHIQSFLQKFKNTLGKFTESRFSSVVQALICDKQTEITKLSREAGKYWREIKDQYYVFDRLEKEVEFLHKLNLSQLKSWYGNYLASTQQTLHLEIVGNDERKTNHKKSKKQNNNVKGSATAQPQSEGFLMLPNVQDTLERKAIKNIDYFKENLDLFPINKITMKS